MHYSECPLYSMLDYRTVHAEESLADKAIARLKNHPKLYKAIVIGVVVVTISAALSGVQTAVTTLWDLLAFFGLVSPRPSPGG